MSKKHSLFSVLTLFQVRIIDMTLSLWTAHQLLMKGWGLSADGSLGMSIITDQTSTLYKTTPAPRVLQNQLDRALEDYCAFLEYKCLQELQRIIRTPRESRTVIYTAVALLLHIRERDIWRLSSWIGGRNSVSASHAQDARKHIDVIRNINGDIQCQPVSSLRRVYMKVTCF
jgi:hypothetical protein